GVQSIGPVATGLLIIRLKEDGFVVALQGRLVLLENIQCASAVMVGLRKIRIDLNGAVDQFKRVGILSFLRRDDPQKMQRARMEGRELQYLSTEGFRLGQFPGLVVGRSFLEQKVHRGRPGSCRLLGVKLLNLAAKSILASGLHAFLSSNPFAEQCKRSRATICCDGGLRRAVGVPTIILPFAASPQRTSSLGTPIARLAQDDKLE